MSRRLLIVVPRLAALLGTSYFLLATSAPPENNYPGGSGGWGGSGGSAGSGVSNGAGGPCYHAGESLGFHVTGTCGPEGDIVVSSPANECAIMVQGAAAVGLPAAGRFDISYGSAVSLSSTAWHLSGYLAEPDAAGTGQGDASVFTVVRDAGADARVVTVVADAGADARLFTVVSDAAADARLFTVVSDAAAHGKAVLRSCSASGISVPLTCSDDAREVCVAWLAALP